jgi:hypothetical protein
MKQLDNITISPMVITIKLTDKGHLAYLNLNTSVSIKDGDETKSIDTKVTFAITEHDANYTVSAPDGIDKAKDLNELIKPTLSGGFGNFALNDAEIKG